MDRSLKDNLRFKKIIEFPSLLVVPEDNLENFNIYKHESRQPNE